MSAIATKSSSNSRMNANPSIRKLGTSSRWTTNTMSLTLLIGFPPKSQMLELLLRPAPSEIYNLKTNAGHHVKSEMLTLPGRMRCWSESRLETRSEGSICHFVVWYAPVVHSCCLWSVTLIYAVCNHAGVSWFFSVIISSTAFSCILDTSSPHLHPFSMYTFHILMLHLPKYSKGYSLWQHNMITTNDQSVWRSHNGIEVLLRSCYYSVTMSSPPPRRHAPCHNFLVIMCCLLQCATLLDRRDVSSLPKKKDQRYIKIYLCNVCVGLLYALAFGIFFWLLHQRIKHIFGCSSDTQTLLYLS